MIRCGAPGWSNLNACETRGIPFPSARGSRGKHPFDLAVLKPAIHDARMKKSWIVRGRLAERDGRGGRDNRHGRITTVEPCR